MMKVIWKDALAVLLVTVMLLTAAVTPVSAAASTVAVPQGVTPVKSWSVVVGTTYKIPDDVKQAGDTYASSNTAILTVNASTGQFTPQSAGIAYIVTTNGGQSRYFKVTASVATTVSTPAATSVFDGFNVTIKDTTTVATTTKGLYGNHNFMYFVSADDRELGSISYRDFQAIINKYKVIVTTEGSGTFEVPPGDSSSWNEWFAIQFNAYRGLGTNAGDIQAAQTEQNAALVEQYKQDVIRLINAEREKAGLTPYIVHEDVMAYSQIRAEELATQFSHTRPNGDGAGFEIIYRGNSPETAIKWWMNSDGHRAAILDEYSTYIGVGVYVGGSSLYIEAYFELDPNEYPTAQILG